MKCRGGEVKKKTLHEKCFSGEYGRIGTIFDYVTRTLLFPDTMPGVMIERI